MKRIYSSLSLEEAEFLRMALRDHGIESVLENAGAALYTELCPISAPFGIIVRTKDVEAAVAVIQNVLDQRRSSDSPGAQSLT